MRARKLGAIAAFALLAAGGLPAADLHWMAHRGGGLNDRPDNTMAAYLYGWSLGGIPEADVKPTKDGVFICLHDDSLERTGTGPSVLLGKPVDTLDYDQIKDVDVGSKFSPEYAGERVPRLEDVFALMREHPERQIYLDLKTNELERLAALVSFFGLEGRVYVSSPDIAQCREIKRRLPGVKTLLWCGGTPQAIKKNFEAAQKSGFDGIDQVQLHLNVVSLGKGWKYALDADYVAKAAAAARARGVDFQVYPKTFEARDLARLLEMDISWYVTDEPRRFLDTLTELLGEKKSGG